MRIAVFNYSSSGLFHYSTCLVNALSQNPTNEILFFTSKYNNLELINTHSNIQVQAQSAPHSLPAFFRWCLNPSEQFRIKHIIEQFQPDVIHITDSYAIYVLHQSWLKKYRIIFTQHDPVSHPGDVFRFSSRIIHRTQQKLANQIVVHGEFLKQTLITASQTNPQKISIIPHGDYSFFQQWQQPDVKPVPHSVLFFGRIVDYKGLDTLLDSIIQLQASRPVTLILAGGGDLTPYRSQLAQIKQKIIVNTNIPDQDVIKYFQMATIVALPYREASQSGIISIALPAGKPIVATKVGALTEILEHSHNSLLVAPNDPDSLAQAIHQLLSDQSLRQLLVAGGYQTVKNKIAWSEVAKQYENVYKGNP